MPRLPSSTDVRTVSPRVQSDPGVRAPAGAFESPLTSASQEFAPAVETFRKVALKQETRRDTVDRSSKINQHSLELEQELSRLSTEADLSRDDVVEGFGSFISERRQKLMEEHGGSEESRALLNMRLDEIGSRAIGKAAAMSTAIGREKVKTTFGNNLSPLIQSAAQDPSLENINKTFLDLETNISDISAALEPNEEDVFRRTGREQIARSAIDVLVARGRIETAQSLLEDGGLSQFMAPDVQREVRRKIETVASERDKAVREIAQAEQILGRPLTQEEKLVKLGFASQRALTERERRITELLGRGLSPELAQDIAANDIRVVGPDKFGNFYSVNMVTNESQLVVGKDAEAINGMVADAKPQEPSDRKQGKGTKLEQDVTKGTGPFAVIQAGISNVIGPFVEGTIFEDTTDARQSVRLFSQIAKTGLINNPRFPVAEQEIVRQLLPDVDKFFIDPERARADLTKLKEFLVDTRESKAAELNKGKITTERRGELSDQISRIDELLTLMETPAESGETNTLSSQEEVDKLKPGDKFIWGPTGEEFVKE